MGEKEYEYIFQIAKDCDGVYCYIKKGELIRCGECKHASTDATCCLVCNREGMGLRPYHVHSDDYCSYAERRTDDIQNK